MQIYKYMCMSMCMLMHIHLRAHTHTHIYIYVWMYVCIYVCMYVCICVFMYICIYIYTCIYTHIYTYIYIYIYIVLQLYVRINILLYWLYVCFVFWGCNTQRKWHQYKPASTQACTPLTLRCAQNRLLHLCGLICGQNRCVQKLNAHTQLHAPWSNELICGQNFRWHVERAYAAPYSRIQTTNAFVSLVRR